MLIGGISVSHGGMLVKGKEDFPRRLQRSCLHWQDEEG